MSAKEQFINQFSASEQEAGEYQARLEAIRQQLARQGEVTVTAWLSRNEVLRPQAVAAADQVILPWWQDLTGRFPRLHQASLNKRVHTSPYLYPHRSISNLDSLSLPLKSRDNAYTWLAQKLLREQQPQALDEQAVFDAGRHWQANLFLTNQDQKLALYFKPTPEPKRTGLYSGYFNHSFESFLNLSSSTTLVDSLGLPEVILDFSKTISRGEIWDKLV
jgi:hypothetical protein